MDSTSSRKGRDRHDPRRLQSPGDLMLIHLDASSPTPLYAQLIAALRRAIVSGDIADGERLPSAQDLAAALDLNRNTVLRAFRDLREEGLVELHRGRGTIARRPTRAPDGGVEKHLDALAAAAREAHVPLADLVAGLTIRGVL